METFQNLGTFNTALNQPVDFNPKLAKSASLKLFSSHGGHFNIDEEHAFIGAG